MLIILYSYYLPLHRQIVFFFTILMTKLFRSDYVIDVTEVSLSKKYKQKI